MIDQGYSYLSLLLNNKADFILEYNEKNNRSLKREDVDWTQSRVIFVAKDFTSYQLNAINFRDLPIELWEAKLYQQDIFLYNQLKSPDTNESIKTVSKSKTIESVSREIKKYTISDHFKEGWETSKEIYEILRDRILEIDSRIEEKFNRNFIGYKLGSNNICTIHTRQTKLNLSLIRVDKEDLKDPDKKIKEIPWKKLEWGKQCKVIIENKQDIDYTMFLIKQVYEKFYTN